MNLNPRAKTILCYGDSNTYGQKPDKLHRYPADVRWTGCLQQQLGDDFYLVEEGLGSRTTDLDYDKKPGRNGKTYLAPCLQSHNPLDVVVIMLGTNDLKMEYSRNASQIAEALAGLVGDVQRHARNIDGKSPNIILASPTLIDDNAPYFTKFYHDYYNADSVEESHKLANAIEDVAKRYDCAYINAAASAKAGEDGIHWDEKSGVNFAVAIAKVVRQFS